MHRVDEYTNSDQNQDKTNFEQNIQYYFDPRGPHTPLVELQSGPRLSQKQDISVPAHNPFSF